MIKRKTAPQIYKVIFKGARSARPAKRVVESIRAARGVIISPSNPIVSIGAILAVPGIRSALRETRAKVVGISPIVGGRAVKGPADKMMRALGLQSTALGVAECYRDLLDSLIIDEVDRSLASDIERLGIKPVVTHTLMRAMTDKIHLARTTMREFA
jgi:LPPG:FO 2-phospho-L-lactate transferase